MDNLFNINRKIHLYAALVTSAFLLMFFLTGAFLIMGKIFPRPMKEILNKEVVMKDIKTENIAEMCQLYDIRGQETVKSLPGNRKSYSYYRPGYRAEILVNETNSTARIRITRGNFWAAMNDFHRLTGYNGWWAHKLWSVFYDLSCLALILVALTGVYLWWKLEKKKKAGMIFMFISTGITVFIVMYIISIC